MCILDTSYPPDKAGPFSDRAQEAQDQSDAGWRIRLPDPKGMPEWDALSDREFRMMTALEGFARDKPDCFPSNRSLATAAGRKSMSAARSILKALEAKGWVRCVGSEADYPGRRIELLKRLDPNMPTADNSAPPSETNRPPARNRAYPCSKSSRPPCSKSSTRIRTQGNQDKKNDDDSERPESSSSFASHQETQEKTWTPEVEAEIQAMEPIAEQFSKTADVLFALLEEYPKLTPTDLRDAMVRTAEKGKDWGYLLGILNNWRHGRPKTPAKPEPQEEDPQFLNQVAEHLTRDRVRSRVRDRVWKLLKAGQSPNQVREEVTKAGRDFRALVLARLPRRIDPKWAEQHEQWMEEEIDEYLAELKRDKERAEQSGRVAEDGREDEHDNNAHLLSVSLPVNRSPEPEYYVRPPDEKRVYTWPPRRKVISGTETKLAEAC